MCREPWTTHDVFARLAELPESERALAQMLMASYTQEEIAKSLGISQQAISRRTKKLAERFR